MSAFPAAPCMAYLPTFGLNWWEMKVNILYMEYLGMVLVSRERKLVSCNAVKFES